MNPNEENPMNENDGDNEKKDWVFFKSGKTWENTIFIDWEPVTPGTPAPFDQASEKPSE